MYIKNGIAYAGNPDPVLKVVKIAALPNHQLRVDFNDGSSNVFDMTPILDKPVFRSLKSESVFQTVYLDDGVPTWLDGAVDIAPEALYVKSLTQA